MNSALLLASPCHRIPVLTIIFTYSYWIFSLSYKFVAKNGHANFTANKQTKASSSLLDTYILLNEIEHMYVHMYVPTWKQNHIYTNIKRNLPHMTILIDLSTAFDTVSYSMHEIETYRCPGKWGKSLGCR